MTTDHPDLSQIHADSPAQPVESLEEYVDAEALFLDRAKGIEELRAAKRQNDKLVEELETLRQDRAQRKWFSIALFLLVTLWLTAVLIILGFDGGSKDSFMLSDIVLTTLVGTTTASVLGLFLVVANYLFPKR